MRAANRLHARNLRNRIEQMFFSFLVRQITNAEKERVVPGETRIHPGEFDETKDGETRRHQQHGRNCNLSNDEAAKNAMARFWRSGTACFRQRLGQISTAEAQSRRQSKTECGN